MDNAKWADFTANTTTVSSENVDTLAKEDSFDGFDEFGGFETASGDPEQSELAAVPSWAIATTGDASSSTDCSAPNGGPLLLGDDLSVNSNPVGAPVPSFLLSESLTAAPAVIDPVANQVTPAQNQATLADDYAQKSDTQVEDARLKKQIDDLKSNLSDVDGKNIQLNSRVQELLAQKTKLETDYERVQESLSSQESLYKDLQKKHSQEIEDLKAASHTALSIIVEEYKELSRTTVMQVKGECEREFTQRLQEEFTKMAESADGERKSFNETLEQMQEKHKTEMETALSVQSEKYMTLLQEQTDSLQTSLKEEFKKSFNKQSEDFQKKMEAAVQEERDRGEADTAASKEQLDSLREELSQQHTKALKDAVEVERAASQKTLDEQQKVFQNAIKASSKLASDLTKQEMEAYTENKLKAAQAGTRRSLAALDVFLESARKQLQLITTEHAQSEDGQSDSR